MKFTKEWYNDIEQIKELLLLNNDKLKFKSNNVRLNEFVMFNKILLDMFGQMFVFENSNSFEILVSDIITFDHFKSRVKSYSYGSNQIPIHNCKCPICGRGWNINNLNDCYSNYEQIEIPVMQIHTSIKNHLNHLNKNKNGNVYFFNSYR